MVEIIAEAGVNHDGDIETAFGLVDIAKDVGADTVKFQTFKTDRLVTGGAKKADYQVRATAGGNQAAMLRKLELAESDFRRLADHAALRGIAFLSTPFDSDSALFLVRELGLDRLKVGSGDLDNLPMLLAIARAGAKVVLSTGMGGYSDVETALSVLAFGYAAAPSERPCAEAFAEAYSRHVDVLRDRVVLLHCTTEYPAPAESLNLRAMTSLAAAFHLPVGFSDHSEGDAPAIASVALGARVLEKHITLDRGRPGPDHAASLDPDGFRRLVRAVRITELGLGDGIKRVMDAERGNIRIARKAVVANRVIRAGEAFDMQNLTLKRHSEGLSANRYFDMIGRTATRDYEMDEAIRVD